MRLGDPMSWATIRVLALILWALTAAAHMGIYTRTTHYIHGEHAKGTARSRST
jgi:hypothetical protein